MESGARECVLMRITIPTANLGLNVKDKLDQMAEGYSFQLDNIIPQETADIVRNGCEKVCDRATNILISFNSNNVNELIGAGNGSIFLINTADGSTTDLATGFESDDWVQSYFTDGAGNSSVYLTNGVDTPQRIYYTADIEGIVTITCEDVGYTSVDTDMNNMLGSLSLKNRNYFFEKDSMNIYYGDLQAITGALVQFNIAPFARDGGSIAGIANWSQDAGQGIDDLLVIFTTEGEAFVYEGDSPEDTNWALRGVFRISKPIGKRFHQSLGGDLMIITDGGFLPLSMVLNSDRANNVAISDKVNPIVKIKDTGTNDWSINYFSKESWVIINTPATGSQYSHEQYILNINTNAWCRFVGWNASDFVVADNRLFYANNGVYEANVGNTDNSKNITYVNQRAYSRLLGKKVKIPIRLTPRYNSSGGFIQSNVRYGIDFKLGLKQAFKSDGGGNSSYWDEAIWDEAFWSDENVIDSYKATTYTNAGEYISVGIYGTTNQPLEFYSMDLLYKAGNGDV